VLEYDQPGDAVADRVFGDGGAGVALDAAGNLYVADDAGGRVVEYDSPLTTDTVYDRVFDGPAGCTATGLTPGLCHPSGVAIGSDGTLYVADTTNRRVLAYSDPLNNGTPTAVITDPSNASYPWSYPTSVAADGAGNLYIAMAYDGYVYEYDAPIAAAAVPTRVFGEGTHTLECFQSTFQPSPSSLCFPNTVAVGTGALYIADTGSNRVLKYDQPLTTDSQADQVYGQSGNFYTNLCQTVGASALCNPYAIGVDGEGGVFVGDYGNYRLLKYDGFSASDTDHDGCSDSVELGANQMSGGQRDPNDEWDFFDVPAPALTRTSPNGARNRAVTIQDVIAIVSYIGTADNGPANMNGVNYDTDYNGNTAKDGREYDRTPSTTPGEPWRSGPPNGAVTIQDALVALAQVGDACAG
jgi:sugar lactone lactonase YvrE